MITPRVSLVESVCMTPYINWEWKVYTQLRDHVSGSWEKSRHFATLPLVSLQNDVWETSAEIPYWWRVTTQIWVVTRHQYNYGMEFRRSFLRRHLAGKPVVVSPNVCCLLRLCECLHHFLYHVWLSLDSIRNFLIKIKKFKFGREKPLVKFIYSNNHRQSLCSYLHPKSWHSNKIQTAMFFIIHFLFQG